MLRWLTAALIGILGLSLLPIEAWAADRCKLGKIAELPVTMRGMKPLVTVKINGMEGLFLADSGAFFSTLSAASAAEFGLKLRPAPWGLNVNGIGGSVDVRVTTVDHLNVAGIDFPKRWDFVVGGSEVQGATGILGQNILRIADVEYDLANGVIRLMKPEGSCRSTNLAYWGNDGQAFSVMDIDWATPLNPHTTGVAFLNGQKIHVMFDTGNSLTVLTRHAAELVGVTPESAGVSRGGSYSGVGQAYTQTWIAPFQSFKIGQEEIRNTRLRIIDRLGISGTDLLIGADFFLSHRIYVATSQRKLYFTYNGGPVFNLTASPNSTQTANSRSNPAAPATDATPAPENAAPAKDAASAQHAEGEPTTAEGFSGRGAAFIARRDFEHAIADLSRACELAPQEPRYFFERAQAYLGNKQPALANADIDQVLVLKPDDVPALMWRARRHLNQRDPAGAVTDLDAVDHAAPQQADLRLDLGALYAAANQLPQAISQYNLWIKVHGEDVRLHNAYNARCWAQSRLGAALDQGIKDCDKAIRLTPNNPVTLESRGLARLQMGDFDRAITDYNASLKLQPRNPWALYGRGLAQARKQKTAAAEEDFAAATALAPHIADEFKKRGMAP
jgi:tetratricopeptide (TPR) repeat protein/predicted aspartyl protease